MNGTPFHYELTFESTTPGIPDGSAFDWPDAALATSFSSGAFTLDSAPGATSALRGGVNNLRGGLPVHLELADTHPGIGPTLPIAPPVYHGTIVFLSWVDPSSDLAFALFASPLAVTYSVSEPVAALLAFTALFGLSVARR